MKIILAITFSVKGKYVHSMLRKEYDSDLFPVPGVKIEDSAWKEPKIPTSITCNFVEGYYLLNFQSVELGADSDVEPEKQMYFEHGWK